MQGAEGGVLAGEGPGPGRQSRAQSPEGSAKRHRPSDALSAQGP